MFILNKQVELLDLFHVLKYDEELFTILFNITNKIEIRKIRIQLKELLSNEDVNNICAKIEDKIRSLETQNIISNEVKAVVLMNIYDVSNNICFRILQNFYRKLFVQNISKLQITIKVQAVIQNIWKIILEAKLLKRHPTIFTNRFVHIFCYFTFC